MAKDSVEQLNKITVAAIGVKITLDMLAKMEKATSAEGKRMDVADIFGIATKFKPGQSALGEYVRFLGQFKATNLLDKTQYASGALIVPKMIQEQLWAVMGGEAVNDVQFAFRIGIKFDATAATKYVFTARSLLPASETDPLAVLESKVKDALKALPNKG